ncbi:MAG: methyltransferase domain-containing protein [Lachnospiraceae bacterium]|nr:methyltransferase domain-containing protein [Lachnospiraceae bacterium]MBP5254313.1 methyltransferase domain-containing protein [Lachnospiraceae bacterium]
MAYGEFAEVYDLLMRDIPYEAWCDYLVKLLRKFGAGDGLLLELGCGTGTMTELLARAGYDMTGIDASPEMLQVALGKRDISGLPILYLEQDMTAFELYGTMRGIVAVCDTMNYLTDREAFLETLRLVNNYLDPGGVFIFDLKTPYFFREVLGEQTFALQEEGVTCIWENTFDEETGIHEYDLTLFREEGDSGLYRRFGETQAQRAYSEAEVRALAEEAGLEFLALYDAFTEQPPKADSERVYVVLREHGKCQKGSL